MTSRDDVVLLAEEHPLLGSALRQLHAATRSLQLAAPVGRLRWAPTMPPAKTCVLWLHEATWRRIHSTRPARLLRRWGNRCRRMLVVESAKDIERSVSRKLLRFDQAETVSVVMISKDLRSAQVFAHTIDCVDRTLLGTSLVANATARTPGDVAVVPERRTSGCRGGCGRGPTWFVEGRGELRGHTLRVATTAAVDTIYARFVTENGVRRTVGVEVNMLKMVSEALGFKYELTEPTDLHGLFGQEENGVVLWSNPRTAAGRACARPCRRHRWPPRLHACERLCRRQLTARRAAELARATRRGARHTCYLLDIFSA
ncbi:hypothetical protein FJT64_023461 [Amphibalanus amphitrite]|uniref:Uncharacterized protein n=1 Tax=Amphibalanus amphitrite TaxID=1232801 RepID=A0A6A4WRQ0_AMPAM|nr:hypothetical protein FJT64_023461 [Amphibalanus amphitrite]